MIPRVSTDELVFADQLEIKAFRWPSADAPEQTPEMRTLHNLNESSAGLLVNDGKCDRRGRLWVGTVDPKWVQPGVMADVHKHGVQESGRAAIQCVDPLAIGARGANDKADVDFDVGKVRKVADGMYLSNGMGWSPDDRHMYFVDTTARVVYVFDYDVVTGDASKCHSTEFDTTPLTLLKTNRWSQIKSSDSSDRYYRHKSFAVSKNS